MTETHLDSRQIIVKTRSCFKAAVKGDPWAFFTLRVAGGPETYISGAIDLQGQHGLYATSRVTC